MMRKAAQKGGVTGRYDRLWMRMDRFVRAYHAFITDLSRPFTPQKFRVLDRICRQRGIIMKDICSAFGMQPPTASAMVSALASEGLVSQRRNGRRDRRRVEVRSTVRGFRCWEERMSLGRHVLAAMFADRPEQEQDLVAYTLDDLAARLDQRTAGRARRGCANGRLRL